MTKANKKTSEETRIFLSYFVRKNGNVSLWVFLVLDRIVFASVLSHQMVLATDFTRVHLIQRFWKTFRLFYMECITVYIHAFWSILT